MAEEIQRLINIDTSTKDISNQSINIFRQLKTQRKSIEFQDLIIAATALSNKNSLATLNEKHFDNIEGLDLITPDDL